MAFFEFYRKFLNNIGGIGTNISDLHKMHGDKIRNFKLKKGVPKITAHFSEITSRN